MSADSKRIIIFDTTLRDGEQSPGVSLNIKEKVMIARALAKLGVDAIEAGFPVSSPGDFEGVSAVAGEIGGVTVCGLARCVEKDITRAWEALKRAEKPRIHVFLATSKIHRQFKLRKAEEEIIRLAVEGVKLARSLCRDVEFSPEDASRTEPQFLAEVVEAVIAAGASTVNIPDTVGYAMPAEFGRLIAHLVANVPNIGKAAISVHCHNDLGLATANSLAAVAAGARQVECTINGIGERAGNAALEEVVMGLATRADFFGRIRTGINSRSIFQISRLVSSLTGMPVQRNKSIVGENAFAHSSGIHQDGVLKERSTYEIIRPQDVGVAESQLILDKHSGRHALKVRVAKLGYELSAEELDALFARFKELADKKREVYDADLEALLEDRVGAAPSIFQLEHLSVTAGTSVVPTATIRLRRDKEVLQDAACGDGPVDAVYKAMERLTGTSGKLLDYQLRAVTRGTEAMGEVMLAVQFGTVTVNGRGVSTDIIEASGRAYLEAINRSLARGAGKGGTAGGGKSKRK
ncbi:MAG TPA: 2-isopropylmalate synthase [Planctomycetota bacterium]|nr:2-isopropylmalate synthase [Planctomycetota bacterium]